MIVRNTQITIPNNATMRAQSHQLGIGYRYRSYGNDILNLLLKSFEKRKKDSRGNFNYGFLKLLFSSLLRRI